MPKAKAAKRWEGSTPVRCQICKNPFTHDTFIDAKTNFGPWGKLCIACHKEHGVGLGEGKGQKYRLSDGMLLQGGSR